MKKQNLGAIFFASLMCAVGMLPLVARADSIITPRVTITCSTLCQQAMNRYYLDMTVAMADLAQLLTPYEEYTEFQVFTDSPSSVAPNNSFDARCNASLKAAMGTTKYNSAAQEQRDKAQAALVIMYGDISTGGMGTTAFGQWYDKLPKQDVSTAGGTLRVKVMTLIWPDGSSTNFAVFSGAGNPGSGGVYVGNQNVIDPKAKPPGQTTLCPQ